MIRARSESTHGPSLTEHPSTGVTTAPADSYGNAPANVLRRSRRQVPSPPRATDLHFLIAGAHAKGWKLGARGDQIL